MTKQEQDELVLRHILADGVDAALERKFRDGMTKYKSSILDKDCLGELEPELLDAIVYLRTAQIQRRQVVEKLRTARSIFALSYNPNEHGLSLIDEAIAMLSPKPLAVKEPS